MLPLTPLFSQGITDSTKCLPISIINHMISEILEKDAYEQREIKLTANIKELQLKVIDRDSTINDLNYKFTNSSTIIAQKDELAKLNNIKYVIDEQNIISLTKENKSLSSKLKWSNIKTDGLLVVVVGLLVKIFFFK